MDDREKAFCSQELLDMAQIAENRILRDAILQNNVSKYADKTELHRCVPPGVLVLSVAGCSFIGSITPSCFEPTARGD